ncbi:MAG: energy-coupling factor ABC transporter ATP-binding protein [Planctomycetes bacterium]|nr:energy-coupling factor ABC transporter ATP-binding protein [Planctomycetota bacterium]
MSHHIVEVKDLIYRYPDGTPALAGVTFRIEHGESVGIVGANGAGKSTLLSHLSGCIIAQSGLVAIGEIPVTKKTLPDIRRAVGTIFQDPNDQLFMPTVEEDVAFGPLNMNLPAEEVERRVAMALSKVNALHIRKRPPYRLSGGEKRAAAIATALSMSPDILVLDEPTAALDPRTRGLLIDLLHGFTHTKIIASHDLDMILDVCKRTIVMYKGAVMADGATEQILADIELLHRSGLELPMRMQSCPKCAGKDKES